MELNHDERKICNFYAGPGHLVTSLINFVETDKSNENEVLLISEYDEEQLLLRFNNSIDSIYSNLIKRINFCNMSRAVEEISKLKQNAEHLKIILVGENDYIERNENVVEEELKNEKYTLLNCYEIFSCKKDISKILNKYQYILNCSGVFEVNKVFNDIKCIV